MEKINISDKVLEKSKLIGLNIEDDKTLTVLGYFLDEDLKSIYGVSELESDTFTITVKKDSIAFNSIFTEEPVVIKSSKLTLLGSNTVSKILTCKSGNVTFTIEIDGNIISNELIIDDKLTEKIVNIDKNVYRYSTGIVHNNVVTKDYEADLQSINAKLGSCETYAYNQYVPAKNTEQSILKRIIDAINEGSLVSVRTSRNLEEPILFIGDIYSKLEDMRNKTLFEDKNKKLQKINE